MPTKYREIEDFFFGTEGKWDIESSKNGHLSLSKNFTDQEIQSFYQDYFTHVTKPKPTILSKAIELAQSNALDYPKPTNVRPIDRIFALYPPIRERARMELYGIQSNERGALLDYGCGNGKEMEAFSKRGWKTVGFDFDDAAVKATRERYGLAVETDLRKIINSGIKFDVILMGHVLEHLPKPEESLQEICGLLGENGRIIITTPNSQSLGHQIFRKYWRGLEPPRHLNIFSPESINELSDELGMKAIVSTSSRLAREIFQASLLAMLGRRNVARRVSTPPLIKILGMGFELIESILSAFNSNIGEELFIVLSTKNDD